MLKAYLGHPKGIGVGDMIQWTSALVEFMIQNPGETVELAYLPTKHTDICLNIPGVKYLKVDQHPKSYLNLYDLHLQPGRVQSIFSTLGLDWENKNIWYFPSESEMTYGRLFVNHKRKNIVVPWHLYGRWSKFDTFDSAKLISTLVEMGHNVMVLDQDNVCPDLGKAKVIKYQEHTSLRNILGLVSQADLFVGVSNFAFYAASGTRVPSIGVFTTIDPKKLFYPIGFKDCEVHYAEKRPDLIDIDKIIDSSLRFLDTNRL